MLRTLIDSFFSMSVSTQCRLSRDARSAMEAAIGFVLKRPITTLPSSSDSRRTRASYWDDELVNFDAAPLCKTHPNPSIRTGYNV